MTDTIQKIADELVLLVQNSPTVDWRANVGAIGLRLRALSARASAGEGGEWVMVPRKSTDSMHRAYTRAKYDGPKPTMISDLWDAMLTAAPQPAQAGARGGGDERVRAALEYLASIPGTEPYLRPIREAIATPASPATGDAATWEEEIRRHDATPPEGDIRIGATRHYGGDDWFRELTVQGVTFLAPLDDEDRARHILARPTPEAHTGTVADIPDADLLCRAVHQLAPRARRQPAWARIADVFALGSTYATQLCRRFGVDPETGKKVDALALPAQGES